MQEILREGARKMLAAAIDRIRGNPHSSEKRLHMVWVICGRLEKDAPKYIPTACTSLINIGADAGQYDLWHQIILAALNGTPDQIDLSYHSSLNLPVTP